MGLIKIAATTLGALGNAIDQTASNMWTEYFESGDMTGILMKRGEKIYTKGSRNSGDPNVISSGSGIDVQENQCMILVENGQIVEFCAEPGRYTFDSSQAPSLLTGNNNGLKALLNEVGQRFAAGGGRTNTQRVFYINLGEVQGFKWGSGNITFDHWEHDFTTNQPIWHTACTLMGNGVYSIQITDPGKFYSVLGSQKVGGSGLITKADIDSQIKTEAIAAIRQGVGQLSQLRIGYTDIAAHEADLTKNVDKILDEDWDEARGFTMFRIAIGMMDVDAASRAKIDKFQETRGYTDPSMLAAYMGMGNTEAMKNAASNSAGAVTGFAGMGMMGGNNMNGANIGDLMQQGQAQKAAQQQQAQMQAQKSADANGWTCSCGQVNTGNFCMNCGTKKPVQQNLMKFCPNCGNTFADPSNPPKFCPNCGTKLG